MQSRRFAIGDPQAPFSRLRDILDHNHLLGPDGKLLDDVSLVSIGDYFDYGAAENRQDAAQNGLELLSWLASHPAEQVVIVAGNHDLGRIGELANFSDEEFAQAHGLAADAYRRGDVDDALEAEFLVRYPGLPTAELAARDFAAFAVAQRELVIDLLRQRRLCLAHGIDDTLFCHAGTTTHYLRDLGLAANAGATAIAEELNRRLYEAFDAWSGGPMSIPSIHRPGNASLGEGAGMLYHRPANPQEPVNHGYDLATTMSRRYDARDVPRGLKQVVGHINDKKCRQLLGLQWCADEVASPGAIRHMIVSDAVVEYRSGHPRPTTDEEALMIFIDGGMSGTEPAKYELYEY